MASAKAQPIWDCGCNVARNMGETCYTGTSFEGFSFTGMWKGLFPRIIMIGTLTALQWFIYDSVKVRHRRKPGW